MVIAKLLWAMELQMVFVVPLESEIGPKVYFILRTSAKHLVQQIILLAFVL